MTRKFPTQPKSLLKGIYWTLTLQLRPRLRDRVHALELRESGLFDAHFYCASQPDVAASGEDPLYHYVRFGAREGRDPSPLFDTAHYLSQFGPAAAEILNPLLHFVRSRPGEWRSPHKLFDVDWYIARNPEAGEEGMNPLRHYVEVGCHAGCNPHALFDSDFYLAAHPEVASTGVNPLVHYVQQQGASRVGRAADWIEPRGPAAVPSEPVIAPPPRLIAFYLPQFHPIPENDDWWGHGFTEWTNVTRADPQFPEHQQPRLPADLGFYDLRLPEVRAKQAELAREYGIHGFCYYYYWFEGRRVLERPIEEVLASGEPDFPFCICWANENWTRRWDGLDDEILLAQSHSLASDHRFIQDILPILKDPRYITVDGKPLLVVYRADLLDDPEETAALWRDVCEREGLPGLHLCAVEFRTSDPRPLGFDAAIEFPPHHFPAPPRSPQALGASPTFKGQILDYPTGVERSLRRPNPGYRLYRGVSPSWDNTARRLEHATIFHGATPAAYERWLSGLVDRAVRRGSDSDRFLFINAWNEWAEGACLEPDRKFGRGFLEATRRTLEAANAELTSAGGRGAAALLPALPWKPPRAAAQPGPGARRPLLLVSHDAAAAGSQQVLLDLVEVLVRAHEVEPRVVFLDGGPLLARFERCCHTLLLPELLAAGVGLDEAFHAIVAELSPRGLELALCNTVVTADALAACQREGLRAIAVVHEQPDSIDAMFGGDATMRRIEAHADRIVTVSAFARRGLAERYGIDASRIDVLHPPCRDLRSGAPDREAARRKLLGSSRGAAGRPFLVLGCGSLYPRKGPDLFIELARRLDEAAGRERRFRFVWLGGPMTSTGLEDHRRAAQEAGVDGFLEFAGSVEDVAPWFAAADVFALTSREDPFPLVNMEAMSHGLPVVAFADAGGAPELIGEDAGAVVPFLDVAAMAEAILKLARDPGARACASTAARAKIGEAFSPESYARGLLALARATGRSVVEPGSEAAVERASGALH